MNLRRRWEENFGRAGLDVEGGRESKIEERKEVLEWEPPSREK